MLQVAIRWLLQKKAVTSVIIGCKTMAQLDDLMGASDGWQLSEEDMELLNTSSEYPVPYPYVMINRMNAAFSSL